MSDARRIWRIWLAGVLGGLWLAAATVALAQGGEPEALNPFGPVKAERDDAVPGYVELSNGKIYAGNIYLTRDKRLKLWDDTLKRQREVPLEKVREIECKVKREWMEREWRFKELALDKKVYTGRSYPAREYEYLVTLTNGRKMNVQASEILYVQPLASSSRSPAASPQSTDPERFFLHKRDKGDLGTTLTSLVYVKRVKLGDEACRESEARQDK